MCAAARVQVGQDTRYLLHDEDATTEDSSWSSQMSDLSSEDIDPGRGQHEDIQHQGKEMHSKPVASQHPDEASNHAIRHDPSPPPTAQQTPPTQDSVASQPLTLSKICTSRA